MRLLNYLLMAGHVPAGGQGGGVVRYTVELALGLAGHDDVDLHLGVNHDAVEYFRDIAPRAEVHPVQKRAGALGVLEEHIGGLAPHRRVIRSPIDVVHGVKHIIPIFNRSATSVLTVHDMLLLDRPRDYPTSKRLLLRAPYGSALSRADLLLCVSAATRSRLLSYYPELADRAEVVPLAASTALTTAAGVPVEVLVGRRFALVVGDALPRKNLAFLGRVWAEVTRRPDVQLVVVGAREHALVDQSPIWRTLIDGQQAVCLPRISDDELAWCYRHAALVLCPSLFEGFGLPAAEAEASGAPMVISADPALSAAASRTAVQVASDDVAAWRRAIEKVLARDRGGPDLVEPRRWSDVADDTVRAIKNG